MHPSRAWSGLAWSGLAWSALLFSLAVGILGRGYWTPDEPREADIAWRMSWQDDHAVPLLAGGPFCEKPPLTYWIAGAAIRAWTEAGVNSGGGTSARGVSAGGTSARGNAARGSSAGGSSVGDISAGGVSAGGVPVGGMPVGGVPAWIARLPNLLYALITALAVGSLGRRCVGRVAGLAAAAAISTFLLSYQVAIWLATDAPLLAADAVGLLGLYVGYYADASGVQARSARLRGYSCMHVALALGFLSKSAAAWMVPLLTLIALVVWERRWRELLRWELYLGLVLQAAIILTWVGFVYAGPDGPAHLKVFFWNNLAGRFAQVDAPTELQYAAAHRNSPGKYLIELPAYLWPWTLLLLAAAHRAWRQRHETVDEWRPVRFAIAAFVPTLSVLSVAATARNIYLAPALPGIALLLGWWIDRLRTHHDVWDARALLLTSALLLIATLVLTVAVAVVGRDSWDTLPARPWFVGVSAVGIAVGGALAITAWRFCRQRRMLAGVFALLLAYCALLVGPASQIYTRVDTWQDLGLIGRAIARDAGGRPLILYGSDETTRAFIDMYASPTAVFIPGPIGRESQSRLHDRLAEAPHSLIVSQLPAKAGSRTLRELADFLSLSHPVTAPASAADGPSWAADSRLHIEHLYSLPNGRRYALLAKDGENR